MTMTPLEIDSDLRSIILRYRRDPERWAGHPKGLTQAEAAKRAHISTAWWRQIETGYAPSAGTVVLADMCNVLGVEEWIVRELGYVQIADAMNALALSVDAVIPDHMLDPNSKRPPAKSLASPEAHIRATPGLDDTQIDLLLQLLEQIRKPEVGSWRETG